MSVTLIMEPIERGGGFGGGGAHFGGGGGGAHFGGGGRGAHFGGGGAHFGGGGGGGGFHYGRGFYGGYRGWGFGSWLGANLMFYGGLYWIYSSGLYVPWWWMLAEEQRRAYAGREYIDERTGRNYGVVPTNWETDSSAIDPKRLPPKLRAELEAKSAPLRSCVQCGVAADQAQLFMCADCGDQSRVWCGQRCGQSDAEHGAQCRAGE